MVNKEKDRFKQHITKSGKVTWYFQAYRTTRRGFETKKEAQIAFLEMEKQHRPKEKRIIGSNEKFIVVAEEWFEDYYSKNDLKESTYQKRKEQIRTLSRWMGSKKICDITTEYLEKFFYQLRDKGRQKKDGTFQGYSSKSVVAFRQVLNLILKYCVKNQILSDNPMKYVYMPRFKKTVTELRESLNEIDQKYLTTDELQLFLNYSSIYEALPMSTLHYLLFYSGCRVSEALALQPEDIDPENNEILIYKQTYVKGKAQDFKIETTKTNGSARRVPVTGMIIEKLQDLIEMLRELRKKFPFKTEDEYLFVYLEPHKRGVPFRREYVNDHFKALIQRCGIQKKFHTHLTRHTMTSLIAPYFSWDVLKARLGHTDSETTKIYRHLTADERFQPLAAFKQLEV